MKKPAITLSQSATSTIIALLSLPAVLQTTCQKYPELFFWRVVGIVLEFREWFQRQAAAAAAERKREASGCLM